MFLDLLTCFLLSHWFLDFVYPFESKTNLTAFRSLMVVLTPCFEQKNLAKGLRVGLELSRNALGLKTKVPSAFQFLSRSPEAETQKKLRLSSQAV